MKRRATLLGLTLAVGFLFFVAALTMEAAEHERGHAEEHQHEHAGEAKRSDKVRCAIDGMMMRASVMTKISLDGKTYYFCNTKQAEMFKAHPDKYLKQISLGHLTFNLNILTVDEYKEMMKEMGLDGMMKMDAMKGKTRHISVYLTQHGQDVPLENVSLALALTDPKGQKTTTPLTYNKMMKTHDAFAAMPSSGEYQIRILMTTSEVNISM